MLKIQSIKLLNGVKRETKNNAGIAKIASVFLFGKNKNTIIEDGLISGLMG